MASCLHLGKGAATLWVGESRPLQDSCGTSGLDHTRWAVFLVIASLTDYLLKQPHARVGFSGSLILSLSSQGRGAILWLGPTFGG